MVFLGVTALLLTVCVIFLLVTVSQARRKNKARLPPGPTPLPILGNILQLNGKEVFRSFIKFAEKYGPVYTIYMGTERIVVLSGYEAVKTALNDNGDVFSGRGHMPLIEKISAGGHGEEAYRVNNGLNTVVPTRLSFSHFLTEEFRKTNGQPVDPTYYFSKAVSNVISSVVFGNRFEYEDKDFLRLLNLLNETFRGFSSVWAQVGNANEHLLLPGPHKAFFKAIDGIQEFIAEKVKLHQESLDPNSPRDFIDCFLVKMEQVNTEFHMTAIVNTTFDMFTAGTETVSTTLRYGLMILLKHPDVEERIHREIDQIIGRNRAPCIEDRSRMPYTDAVVHEIQRFIDLIPLGIPHKVTQDIEIKDYVIPKDTTIYPLLSSVLQDPKLYKYPYDFNPGHFLDKEGKFCRNDAFMPFSSGKRICVGEGLARMELFLFLTTILQNFTLRSPVDTEKLDLTPEISGFGNCPRPYQLCFITH
uniref:unspecific monooxygenase n=1 Tax=Leptobrachium leishanense TaxID=445787 RepID=A0A8C5RA81_9ANUR